MQTEQDVGFDRSPRSSRRAAPPEGGLPELLDALRWRWKPTVAIALLFTAGATAYIQSLPSKYDGKALVSIEPRVKIADSNLVRVVGPKYSDYITAPSTIATVAPTIGETPGSLNNAISASIATDTGNMTVTARMPSADRAARAANAFARQGTNLSKNDPLLTAQLVAKALPDSQPASPPRKLLELASLFMGGLIAVVVSVLLERGRPRLRSWRDITRITGYPILGRIPPARVLHNHPTHAFADVHTASAFRILRANLEPQLREGGVDFLVVTSPSPGDGKTTVAAMLGESLSRLGMKVLLVDADLRRPGISSFAHLAPEPGLSGVLRNGTRLKEAIRQGWVPNLSVLPTSHDSGASELLSQRFGEAIDEARGDFDVILVDTPPLLSTDDPRTLAAIAKGIVLVVSAGSTQASVNEAILAVESLNAPLIGIVGNRFKEAGVAYYY
jgi:succinoglycan biosynthesis transport protein ExoP